MRTTHGIFVGLATVDVVYQVDTFAENNTKIAARSQEIFAGGPATNAAIAFRHLGGAATLAAAVGRHPITSVMRDEFARHSLQLIDLHPGFEGAPPISSVSVNPQGERSVVSANAIRIGAAVTEADEQALANASVLLVDGHQMQACQAWARAARARKIPVVLDGGSWKAGTEQLLPHVDVAICSADFAPPGCGNEEEVVRYLQDAGVPQIAISHGAGPILFVTPESFGSVRVPDVDAIDTMGAGDVLHGAFCYFFAIGQGFADALAEAARIASESCRYGGTRAWMRSEEGRQDSAAMPRT